MLREAIQAAMLALDEVYVALEDDESLTAADREQLFTILTDAEDAYTAALRALPES